MILAQLAKGRCDIISLRAGYSKHEKFQSAPGSRVGTPAYLAPEVILTTKGKTYDGKVGSEPFCSGVNGQLVSDWGN